MKSIIYTLFLFSLFGCKEIQKTEKHNSDSTNITTSTNNTKNTIEKNTPEKIEEKIVWNTEKVRNFTFSLPSNFHFESNLSSYNKKVYIADNENLGITIDIADLPDGYENSRIREMIPNLNNFGNSINQENRRYFDDFRLISTKYSNLGNIESVEVSQLSTKVSGKNMEMSVKAYFVISSPFYCSITFSYPKSSYQGEKAIEKIKKSFSFPEIVEKRNPIEVEKSENIEKTNEIKNVNRPSVLDTKKWILDKFKIYGNPDFTYKIVGWDLIILTTNNPKTAIEYTIPLCNVNVYKNSSHSFSSERISFSTTKGRIKIDRDWKGFPHYQSSFDFDFRFSSEDNLIKRLNDALENLKYYCPENTNSKETF